MARAGRHRQKRQPFRLGFSPVHELKLLTFASLPFWVWWQVWDHTVGRLIYGG